MLHVKLIVEFKIQLLLNFHKFLLGGEINIFSQKRFTKLNSIRSNYIYNLLLTNIGTL